MVLSGHKSSHISSDHLLSWEFDSHKGMIKTSISNSADLFYCGQMFLKTITGTNQAQNNIISCTAERLLICCVQSCIRGTTIPNFRWAIYQSGPYFLERSQTNKQVGWGWKLFQSLISLPLITSLMSVLSWVEEMFDWTANGASGTEYLKTCTIYKQATLIIVDTEHK